MHFSPVNALSAAANRVLKLEVGYIELSPNSFTNLDEVTVEEWIKWDDLHSDLGFSTSGSPAARFGLRVTGDRPLRLESLRSDDHALIEVKS